MRYYLWQLDDWYGYFGIVLADTASQARRKAKAYILDHIRDDSVIDGSRIDIKEITLDDDVLHLTNEVWLL